jgi:hypothetical protein
LPRSLNSYLEHPAKGGVRKISFAESDSNNLKIIPIIENVDEKGDSAVCYVMNLEERQLSDDALTFQNSTPNHSDIWCKEFGSSEESDFVGPNGKTARILEGNNGSGGGC